MPRRYAILCAAPHLWSDAADFRRALCQGSLSNHDHADDLCLHPHRPPPRWRCARRSPPRRRRSARCPRRARRCNTPIRRSCSKAAPAVVNVYVRSRVRTSVSPFANDPFFQRFFGGGRLRPAAGAHPILARLRRHHQCRRRHRHQHACRQGRHRHADPRGAVRQARVRRAHRRPGRAHRSRRAQDREGRQRLSVPAVRRQRQARGRRRGARHRQSVRRRPDGDQRHHLGAWRARRWRSPRRRCSCRPTPPSIPATPAARWST